MIETENARERGSGVVVKAVYFKPGGKYYAQEMIELPRDLAGSIDMADGSGAFDEAAADLMYRRQNWIRTELGKRYGGMHAVCLDSDVLGFPAMVPCSGSDGERAGHKAGGE